jgi:zinc protease
MVLNSTFRCLLGMIAIITISCLATVSAQELKPLASVEGITEYQLENGVKVLLFPDDSKPQFTVNMTVMVGSRHEGYGESGMAHLLEHMLFRGTDLFPDIPKLLKDRGVLNMNGTTSFDRTNYFETLPAKDDNLEFAISMEADRLTHSWIKQEHLDSEMTIVRSEFERGENSPQRMLMQRIMSAAFEWHNYGKSTIGNRSDIMRVPASNLRMFYRKFYQPDNITVVIAGKFDPEQALSLVKKHFGSIPRPERELPKTYTEEPQQDGERITVLRRAGDVELVGLGYHVPSASSSDYAAVEVLAELLSMQPAGRLYKGLVEPKLASSAAAFDMVGHDPGLLLVMAEVATDSDLETVQETLIKEVETLADKGVSKENVVRAVRKILKNRERNFANTEKFATDLSEWESYGDWRLYFLHRDRLEAVTPADIEKLAQTYLIESNRTVGQFIPTKDPVRATVPSSPDAEKLVRDYQGRAPISAGEAFEATPENIDQRTTVGQLESGIKYALLPKETRGDRVVLSAELHYGNLESLSGYTIAADLLPRLMMRGTKELSFQKFRDRLDELQASVGISGSVGTIKIAIQAKREYLPAVLELVRQALREPTLDEAQFEIIRNESVTKIKANISDPVNLAFTEFSRQLDPQSADDVRYTPTLDEKLQRTESVRLSQVKTLYETFVGGQHGEVVVVGDFDSEPVLEKLNSMFADWTAKESYSRIEEPVNPKAASGRMTIETPDKANAVYIAGLTLPVSDDDPDYEAMLIGNYIMGGGPLSSRISDRVRKQDGLSYTAMTQFQADAQDDRGLYMTFCISNPANTERVVATVAEVNQTVLDAGVTEDELSKAKESYLTNRQGKRAKDSSLAKTLLTNLKTDRTMQFQAASDRKIESLTKESTDAALKRLIQPEKMFMVTAGDFEGAAEEDSK